MAWLQDLPIKRKLTAVILITCSTVLILSGVALALLDYFDFRRSMVRDMEVLADILGKNTRAALAFQDENVASEILQALQSEPHVVSACLYDAKGNAFAKYLGQEINAEFPARPIADGHHFEKGNLTLFRPVILNEKRIGTIYVQADLEALYDRLRLIVSVATIVLLGSVLVAFFLSSRLQRPISRPILALAETAKVIAERKDYSVRAENQGKSEVGALTDAFNQMLTGIQERETALRSANEALRAENMERTRAEQALDQSEERNRAVIEVALDGIITMNHEGRIVDFNPAAERIFGYQALDVKGKALADIIISPELREKHHNDLARFLATGEGVVIGKTIELPGLRADGSIVPIELSITRMPGTGSAMFTGFLRDITERKLAESKLKTQLAQLELLNRITRGIGERQDLQSIFQVVLRNLEENLPVDFCCVCLYDTEKKELTVKSVGSSSQAIAKETGMVEGASIEIENNGLSRCLLGKLVYEPNVAEVQMQFSQRVARSGLRSLVAAPLLVESQIFGILLSARKAENGFNSGECEFLRQLSGHVALASHQTQLYTALQQAYDDLRFTQQAVLQQERLRALGQMASGIAHDINNAISPVALYAEILLEREKLSERARGYLVIIQHAIEDVAHTVSRMREFYRQREPQLVLVPVHINQLVDQVADLTRARWFDMPQQRGIVIELKKDLAPNLPPIMGVESEIREALTNLIFNAVDAMPEGGPLTLRTRETGDQMSDSTPALVHVEVTDGGVGMDEETRRRCLEPFFTTKGERGTGLGLAMVYGTARRHSAGLEIESEPGKGVTVRLSFSVPSGVTTFDFHEKAYTIPSPLRLLIVDDDPILLQSLRDTLELDGHDVVTASGGQQGIDEFRQTHENGESFSAVITDLGMPYVDGRKVATAIKSISPDTPVFMLTGWGERLTAEGDIPENIDRLLNKPAKLRDLRDALAQYCNK